MNSHGDEIRRPVPYAISLSLEKVPCLVVGGGTVALRKVESLIASGARVKVVSPQVLPEIEALEEVEIARHEFRPRDLDGQFLVISATNSRSVNGAVAKAAKRRSMLVNVVDDPELCNFYVNSQVRRGDLTISVSTGGASPALAKRIRKELEHQYGKEYTGLLLLMREYRPMIIREVPDAERRRKVFERLANARIEKIYREQGEAAARKSIEDLINEGAYASERTEQES
ncbi:MAG: bifunctional precorrin-2 dehydrogenase/sirohydrochlorin ferrochelatase [Candidatus Hydrogenedentota bacterium]|nr:MAG: bifunctional precorrin-2 dehydrogenase/sirohydrochlorin ferrochelatase [Candidatus Hydrogenedentota bacterium]